MKSMMLQIDLKTTRLNNVPKREKGSQSLVPLGVFNSNFGAISDVSDPKGLSVEKYRGYCANSTAGNKTLNDGRKRVIVNDRTDLEMSVQIVFIHLTSNSCGVTRRNKKGYNQRDSKPY